MLTSNTLFYDLVPYISYVDVKYIVLLPSPIYQFMLTSNTLFYDLVIEIIDIECMLLSFFSENFVSTKWRIYKGIFGSSRLLREGISRGCEECECFFAKQSLQKDINSRF